MALDLSALAAEVARDRDINNSAVTVMNALLAEVEANKSDPVALQALVDEYRANNDALAAAIAAIPAPTT